jgi:hypothetical protein
VKARFALLALAAIFGLALLPTAATADPPAAFPFEESFDSVNPCTGLDDTTTVTGTFYVYERGVHGISHRLDRTVTTSSGFSGHGTEISIDHDSIFEVHDVLTNRAGEHILASFVFVQDAHGTPRVEHSDLRCAP